MKFSGHETFPIREGWLHKGLKLLAHEPELFLTDEVSDVLGIGRNMAKSLKHWLQATGLAEQTGADEKSSKASLRMTKLGELIWDRDRFFMEVGTWWILHINLIRERDVASTWHWFFNKFNHDRFDRAVCLESLRRYIDSEQKRVPSASTIQRDLGCMLFSYARSIPPANEDPEDGADCPFRELGLLNYYKNSGQYQVHQGVKDVPLEVFCYSMSIAFSESLRRTKVSDIRLHAATRQAAGPGRAFCLTGESLFETVSRLEDVAKDKEIQIAGIAGDRAIRIQSLSPFEWIERFYQNSVTENTYAI